MNWYYVSNSEQKGPVDDLEFERLVQHGSIDSATLVWREGLANWQPYQELRGQASLPSLPAESLTGGVLCSECGLPFTPDQVIRLENRFVCAGCKPIVVQKLREGVVNSGAEQIRKDHIKHEASVRSVGALYLFGASVIILLSVVLLVSPGRVPFNAGVLVVFFALAALQIWTGLGLRRLQRWARIPSGILSGIGLLGFPAGTLINAYILYLLFSKKGSMVFSEEYQRIIEETPHIKYRTSIVIWILVGLLLLLLVAGLVAALLAPHRR